jgi:membrane associated rhomboid family serine protease
VLKRFTPILALVASCWIVFVVNSVFFSGALDRFGIVPRHVAGLPGILCAPLLHASFKHLLANTLPLLVLGGILCVRSRAEFWTITVAGTLVGGALTWVFARHAYHIGASGLIFCFFGYIASLAWFQRTLGSLVLSAACILFYGGMLKGLVPASTAISWESHVAGFAAGILLAWMSAERSPRRASWS